MTYRHHSLRCHHRIQNTQGTNEHQFRITCQQCQGHLAIVYGRHLTAESRRLIQEHLDATTHLGPIPPPPVQRERRPQPRVQGAAAAAAATPEPQDEPEPTVRQQDVEALIQECQELRRDLAALPRPVTPQTQNPPEADPQEMPRAQGSPRQHRPHP